MIALLLALASCSRPPAFACCSADPGVAAYTSVDPTVPVDEAQRAVVVRAVAAGVLPTGLDVDAVARAAAVHARSATFWRALEEHAADYGLVGVLATGSGREPMLAAVPLLLSGYDRDLQSAVCALGPWQLPVTEPLVAVGPCRLVDSPEPWDRTRDGVDVLTTAGRCRIARCEPDERRDLEVSTRAVLMAEPSWPVNRHVAAGVHLLAVCALRTRPGPPPFAAAADHCDSVGIPGR